MARVLMVFLLALALVPPAAAEDLTGRYGFGIEGGYMKLILGDRDYSNVDQFMGLHLQRGLSPRWSLGLALKYGYVRPGVTDPAEDAGLTLDSGAGFYTIIWQPRLDLLYHLAPDGGFSPVLGLGVGATRWSVEDLRGNEDPGLFPNGRVGDGYDTDGAPASLQRTDLTFSFMAGADWFLNDNLALNLGGRFHWLPFNNVDNIGWSDLAGSPDYVDANTGLVEAYAGLTYHFGSGDSDKDGIRNKEDLCPQQPEDYDGFRDEDGCPDPDNDQDGIADVVDGCPNEPEDADGFHDDDGCPDPDNDGDGILDTADRCPDEAEDADGYQDADGCPDPDNDGDGVPDAADHCPSTPADVEVDDQGCPVVEEIKESLILEGVGFQSGSAVLTPESRAVLDRVAQSLQAYPEATIEVRGHTDSVGPAENNRVLSQRRAIAVREYLIRAGITPARITAIGYGEDYPIASNETPEGRAKNRRVEIQRTN
jgi:outer membrane protein OmpA-like peptidoglycan-associated protein/opacity protein-like surface antigen